MESLHPYAIEIARFLIDLSIKSVLIIAVAALATVMLRKSSAAAKHFIWFTATMAIWALPLLGMMLPAIDLNLLPSGMLTGQPSGPGQQLAKPPLSDGGVTGEDTGLLSFLYRIVRYGGLQGEGTLSGAAEPFPAVSLIAGSVILWAIGALAVLISLLISTISVRKLIRAAVPVPEELRYFVEHLAGKLGIGRSVKVSICPSAPAPFTSGIFRHRIVLDEESAGGSPEAVRSILLHELAHIKRADIFTQALAQLVCVIQWFNPLAWLVARRMIVERELACDNFVLSAGVKASSYARQLLEIAALSKQRPLRFLATAAMTRRNSFKERMMSILNPLTNRRDAGRAVIITGILVAVAVALSLAALQPWFEHPLSAAVADTSIIARQEIAIDRTQNSLCPGDPFVIALNISEPVDKVEGLFLGQKVIFKYEDGLYMGITLVREDAHVGDAEYQVLITSRDGHVVTKSFPVEIVSRERRTALLKNMDSLYGIKQEQTKERLDIESTLSESTLEPQWIGHFIMPAEGRVTLPFGANMVLDRDEVYIHNGVDLSMPSGTLIKSSNAGKVVIAKRFPGYGNCVVVDHGGGIFSLYAHLQECSVNVGQVVKKGDVIGLCGSTGKSSGPHLHWSISINGEYCDPLKLIEEK